MDQIEGLFTFPKNKHESGLTENRRLFEAGAKRYALRPLASVLFNLINRTHKGSLHGR